MLYIITRTIISWMSQQLLVS